MPNTTPSRSWSALDWVGLASCLLIAIVFRGYRLSLYPFIGGEDGINYVTLATNLLHGQGYTLDGVTPHTLFPPAYPWLIALLKPLFGSLETAALAGALLPSLLLVGIVFLLAHQFFNSQTAWGAALFTALSTPLILYATVAMSEALLTALVWGALWGGWRLSQTWQKTWALGVGCLWGLSYLTKPEGLVMAGAWLIWLVVQARRAPSSTRAWAAVGVACVALGVCVLGYVLYLHQVTGQWSLSGKGAYNFLLGEITAQTSEAADVQTTFSQQVNTFDLWRYLAQHPGAVAQRWWHNFNTEREMVLASFGLVVVVLASLHYFAKPLTLTHFAANVYLLLPGLWLLVLPFFFLAPRLWLVVLPGVYIAAGGGLAHVAHWLQQALGMANAKLRLAALLGVMALIPLLLGYYTWRDLQNPPWAWENKTLGIWMRQTLPQPLGTIAGIHPLVAFYAEAEFIELPRLSTLTALRDQVQQTQAQYVVVSEAYTGLYNPELAQLLLDQPSPPLGFVLLQQETWPQRIALYAVAP